MSNTPGGQQLSEGTRFDKAFLPGYLHGTGLYPDTTVGAAFSVAPICGEVVTGNISPDTVVDHEFSEATIAWLTQQIDSVHDPLGIAPANPNTVRLTTSFVRSLLIVAGASYHAGAEGVRIEEIPSRTREHSPEFVAGFLALAAQPKKFAEFADNVEGTKKALESPAALGHARLYGRVILDAALRYNARAEQDPTLRAYLMRQKRAEIEGARALLSDNLQTVIMDALGGRGRNRLPTIRNLAHNLTVWEPGNRILRDHGLFAAPEPLA